MNLALTTKFGVRIVFRKTQRCAKFQCPTSAVTLFSKDGDGQGWISDMGIDGPTFVPKRGYFLLIWVKVCPQKFAFS